VNVRANEWKFFEFPHKYFVNVLHDMGQYVITACKLYGSFCGTVNSKVVAVYSSFGENLAYRIL
jgi:hypothetical protein